MVGKVFLEIGKYVEHAIPIYEIVDIASGVSVEMPLEAQHTYINAFYSFLGFWRCKLA